MNRSLQNELQELVDEMAPPLIEIDELLRPVVAVDADPTAFDGECSLHEGCRSVLYRRGSAAPDRRVS